MPDASTESRAPRSLLSIVRVDLAETNRLLKRIGDTLETALFHVYGVRPVAENELRRSGAVDEAEVSYVDEQAAMESEWLEQTPDGRRVAAARAKLSGRGDVEPEGDVDL